MWIPYTTLMARMARQPNVSQISVRLADGASSTAAEKALVETLKAKHGKQDFFVMSSDTMRQQLGNITLIFSVLLGSIGGISLVVGGIGVMNIMLVSVSERIREIGVRTAVGARRSDIMSQFMIEAVLVCLIGGGLGVALSLTIGWVFSLFVKSFRAGLFGLVDPGRVRRFDLLIGLVFGWLPARARRSARSGGCARPGIIIIITTRLGRGRTAMKDFPVYSAQRFSGYGLLVRK